MYEVDLNATGDEVVNPLLLKNSSRNYRLDL